MTRPDDAAAEQAEYARRMRINVIAAIGVLALLAAFYVVVDQVIASNKAQLCIESGGRKCRQMDRN